MWPLFPLGSLVCLQPVEKGNPISYCTKYWSPICKTKMLSIQSKTNQGLKCNGMMRSRGPPGAARCLTKAKAFVITMWWAGQSRQVETMWGHISQNGLRCKNQDQAHAYRSAYPFRAASWKKSGQIEPFVWRKVMKQVKRKD